MMPLLLVLSSDGLVDNHGGDDAFMTLVMSFIKVAVPVLVYHECECSACSA